MNRYRVIQSTVKMFEGVEVPLDDEKIVQGEDMFFMGMNLTVRQFGGGILTLADETNLVVLQGESPVSFTQDINKVDDTPQVLDDPDKLIVNREIDIFFETKEIRLNFGQGNLTEEHGVTYDAIYRMLMKEWKIISSVYPQYGAFPMEHAEGTNNYCFLRCWNWHDDYTLLLKDGCWSRKDDTGKHI